MQFFYDKDFIKNVDGINNEIDKLKQQVFDQKDNLDKLNLINGWRIHLKELDLILEQSLYNIKLDCLREYLEK